MSGIEAPPLDATPAAPEPATDARHEGPEPVIRTRKLTKRYGTLTAVDRLDLEVYPGEVFGLLGQNGAGKTTTILMLLGLSEPTDGEATVMGLDPAWEPREVKRRVGYLPDAVGFYEGMTGRENLRYTARLNGLDGREAAAAIDEVLEQVGLTESRGRPGRDVLARHAPAARHRGRPGQVTGPAHPRRADDVDRPDRRGRDPRPAAPAGRRAGPGDHAVEPSPQPGPDGLRPDRHLRQRPAHRGRHGRGAGGHLRRRERRDRGRAGAAGGGRCRARRTDAAWHPVGRARSTRRRRAAARGASTSGRPTRKAASARTSSSPPSSRASG